MHWGGGRVGWWYEFKLELKFWWYFKHNITWCISLLWQRTLSTFTFFGDDRTRVNTSTGTQPLFRHQHVDTEVTSDSKNNYLIYTGCQECIWRKLLTRKCYCETTRAEQYEISRWRVPKMTRMVRACGLFLKISCELSDPVQGRQEAYINTDAERSRSYNPPGYCSWCWMIIIV